ncbi:hypothetical protein B1L04_18690 [Microcystis aeruginosa KW]|uniref:Uncharacterized protein n=1 Tax=Microcystis aeruginosa KW TaxID=1960155 RepID=A0A1V4BUL8_MICAE|nr:hypothetical protein B1L04_18690 [Microcystis aeruginosa KW]
MRKILRERSRNSNREVWESPSVYGGEDVKNLLGGSGGKEFYEGVILPNGDLKTNWQLTPFMNLAVVTNYIFGFVLIVFGSDSAIADCVESL